MRFSTRSLNGNINPPFRALNYNKDINNTPLILKKIKEKIFDLLMFPLIQNNPHEALKNSFLIPRFKKKLQEYQIYSNYDNHFYEDILDILGKVLEHIEENETMQKKMLENNDGVGDFRVRVSRIRLLAQYEIYNDIFGVPNKGDRYDDTKISFIKKTIRNDNLSFREIEELILKKFT